MLSLSKSFTDNIDQRVSLSDEFVYIDLLKNECSDIIKMARKFQNKTGLFNFLMKETILVPKYTIVSHNIQIDSKLRLGKNRLKEFKMLLADTITLFQQNMDKAYSGQSFGQSSNGSDYKVCTII